MSSGLLSRLARVLPAERLLSGPEQLAAYESDALTAFRSRPLAVAIPETAAEVIALVRFCREEKLPFVARGSGTSLSGGSLPVAGGIVIGLNRLNRILRLDPELRLAVVEPGVVNTQVSQAAAPHGLHYSPDPSSQSICTIGGNVAFNSGGAHCLKYGMTSNHVLGLRAVLATGEVVEWGGVSCESVGPDWCGLFTGNEGLFGIALEITLQLLPRPECFHTVLAGYRSLEQAGNAVSVALTERFIEVMASEHREFGLGDPTLGKTVRKLVGMLAGRTELWRGGARDWIEATRESLYKGVVEGVPLQHSAGALQEFARRLEATPLAELEQGRIA